MTGRGVSVRRVPSGLEVLSVEQLVIPGYEAAENAIEALTSGAGVVSGMVTTCFSMIAANPLLCALAASGLACVGVRVFRSARRASR